MKNVFICPIVRTKLPAGFVIRPLERSDYEKGFLECLAELTSVGQVSRSQFRRQYRTLCNETYVIIVIENLADKSIAACGTLLLEDKFIHACGKVGHIEDIVVRKRYRGKNFGKFIIEQLKVSGQVLGCYKLTLDCSATNVPFYEKCGFKEKERQMVLYYEDNNASLIPKGATPLKSKL